MLEEKLLKKIKTINENFINLGFDLEEDFNSYILNLEDCQISFDVIEGEDEEGPWFEVECNIIFF